MKASPYFPLPFDETLNGGVQEEHLDCHVTYWDDSRKEVCSRYLDSHFLRRPNAQNILNLLLVFGLFNLSNNCKSHHFLVILI